MLDDIYQYNLPPKRRVPPLLWTRLRADLPDYLTDSEADGVVVINWYHRQFRSHHTPHNSQPVYLENYYFCVPIYLNPLFIQRGCEAALPV